MLVQIVITDEENTLYDLRLQPGRYKVSVTAVNYVTSDPARGDIVEFESLLFRQLFGTNQYFTICDNSQVFNRTGSWEADVNGPVFIQLNHRYPAGALNFSRCIIYLDMEQVS